MFAKKLIAIAATVALAVAHVAAVEEATHISVRITNHHHHTKQDSGNATETEGDYVATVDIYDSGSGSESWDSGESSGSSESSASGESSGSEAPWDDDSNAGSYGTYPTSGSGDDIIDVYCDGDDASQMSVEGVEGVFCVSGQACVADILGACPGPQDGLEFGSYCGTVQSGVYGCKPYTEAPFCTGEGESQMSVEGVEGIFCVTGQACAGDIEGACPEAQDGLEYGSYCGTVSTGVYGCKPNDAKHHKKGHFAKHPAHYKPTHFKPAKVKAAAVKVEHKKVTVKKVEAKKPVVHKVEAKKPEHKKPAQVKKTEIKKVEHVKKVEAKKPVHKVTVHKVEAKKPEHKKVEAKKPEHKKVEAKKPEHKKVEAKKPEHKKVEAKKPEHKKDEHKKPEHKKDEHKKPAVVVKKVEHKHTH